MFPILSHFTVQFVLRFAQRRDYFRPRTLDKLAPTRKEDANWRIGDFAQQFYGYCGWCLTATRTKDTKAAYQLDNYSGFPA